SPRLRMRARVRPARRRGRIPEVPASPVLPPLRPEPVHRDAEPAPAPSSREFGQGSALELYLREIAQVKLLTPKEEVTLAHRIRKGDEQAREQMIKANLRLVVKIAHDYDGLGLPLLDLINEGNIGLIKGVERFDPGKGAKLSTYAAWWIKQAIKRALANQSKTIRLPVHVVDKVAHIRRAEVRLRETLDRDPTDEEVAADVGLKPGRVRQYRQASKAPVPLDAPLGTGDDTHQVAEVVADANAAAPFDHLVKASDAELLREVFATLAPREKAILAMRYGLEDDTPRTLEEIGAHFGVTRERIRQIQKEALGKLRTKVQTRDRLPVERIVALAE
ncbi:MAG TPA: RNA polymerase sigma factor RpoD/SigA, partial [Dongiaceae bacterium]|nr:RNA polymerase sigma factor RpoD/SigA [Dongiaceae bacterium]